MRYLFAIVFALLVALAAVLYVSSPIATWIVAQFSYDSPDAVADLHSTAFMGVNVLALIAGWMIGWVIGGFLEREEPPI